MSKMRTNNENVRLRIAFLSILLATLISFGFFAKPNPLYSESLGGVTLLSVEPRIITPNGDLLNDAVHFKFDTTLTGLPLESEIFDVNGAKVANMTLNTDETHLVWDGKDESKRSVPSGIYLYAIKIGDNLATGSVVVAK